MMGSLTYSTIRDDLCALMLLAMADYFSTPDWGIHSLIFITCFTNRILLIGLCLDYMLIGFRVSYLAIEGNK